MFAQLWQWLFGGRTAFIEAYWCSNTIKLGRKTENPGGGKVTVVTVCIDVRYSIENGEVVLRDVVLSTRGGAIMGSNVAINVASARTGEAWHATDLCSSAELYDLVQRELALANSSLLRMMQNQWGDQPGLASSLCEALNNGASLNEIEAILKDGCRGQRIAFTYKKPDGSRRMREVTVRGLAGSSLKAEDHEDGETKSFRLDRISNARTL